MNLEDMLTPPLSGAKPGQGSLLIANPMMREQHFSRSVIMILDVPASGGELGLVLNKPTNLTLSDLVMMPDWDNGRSVPIFSGGPVDLERLFMLHSLGEIFPGSQEISPGIFVGANVDDIINYIDSGGEIEGKMRLFLGYSGWAPGQLNCEIERRSWIVDPLPDGIGLLSGAGTDYWRKAVEQLGPAYRSWLMFPPDPSYN